MERPSDSEIEPLPEPSRKVSSVFDPNLPVARYRLLRLGMIIASDWLIGNRDRVGPEGEGNGGNLIARRKKRRREKLGIQKGCISR